MGIDGTSRKPKRGWGYHRPPMPSRTTAQLLDQVGRIAPWSKAAGWDPVGLQLGDPEARAERVAVCHEVNERVMEAISDDPPDLLITYHPLLFRAVTRLTAGRSAEGRAYRLVRMRVSLAVVHTAFDAAPGGTADALAEALGLDEVRRFATLEGEASLKLVTFLPEGDVEAVADRLAEEGAGRIGDYSHCSFRSTGVGTFLAPDESRPAVGTAGALNREPEVRLEMVLPKWSEDRVVSALLAAHPYEEPAYDLYDRRGIGSMIGRIGRIASTSLREFSKQVGEVLDSTTTRVSGDPDRPIESVAVVPGSGSDFIGQAASAGADVIVTGDVSHHRAVGALDRGLAVIDPGHAASERPGVRRLYAAVVEVVHGATDFTSIDASPWES